MTRIVMDAYAVAWNTRARDQVNFGAMLEKATYEASIPIVGLMEVNGGRLPIVQFARRHRYSIVTGTGEVGGSTQLLVADEVMVIDKGVINVTRRWHGPKGKLIRGRSFPWVKVRNADGTTTVWIVAHMVWGPWKNWAAHRAELRALTRFIRRQKGSEVAVIGDLNQPASRRGVGSMRALARRFGGRIVPTGAGIDYGLYRPPASQPRRKLHGMATLKYGSDHPAVYYRRQP